MSAPLPPLPSVEVVRERLLAIFPDGFEQRTYATRMMAAKTVFTMLYMGAVEGAGRYLAPSQVVRMSDEQSQLTSDAQRLDYVLQSATKGFRPRGEAWYEQDTREPIRDEGLRTALIPCGAVLQLEDIAKTSGKGRYYLASDFTALFDPALDPPALAERIKAWRAVHLTPAALARIAILAAATTSSKAGVEVRFPKSSEGRRLGPGESSRIAKAVIEEFAERFLSHPAVLWISESGNKVVHRDEILAKRIRLNIQADKVLPDIILADVGGDGALLVFVEVVSTDGPINDLRRTELMALAAQGGYRETDVAFVTAYMARDAAPLKRNLGSLAWNSFIWLASEPDGLIAMMKKPGDGRPFFLRDILSLSRG